MICTESRRLLWKLWREVGGALPALIVGPPIGFALSRLIPHTSAVLQFASFTIAYGSAFIVPGIAGMIGAARGHRDWDSDAYGPSHLPVTASALWTASFLVPLLCSGVLGLWTGWWSLVTTRLDTSASAMALYSPNALAYYAIWAVFTSAVFAIGYTISAVGSRMAGAGSYAVMAGLAAALLLSYQNGVASGRLELTGEPIGWASIVSLVLAPTVASLVWAATRRKLRLWRQVGAFSAAALTLVVLCTPATWVSWTKNLSGVAVVSLQSQDGSLDVSMQGQHSGPSGAGTYCNFTDRRTGVTKTAHFPLVVQAVGFAQPDIAMIASRHRGERRMTISRWTLADNRVEKIVTIPFNPRSSFKLGTDDTYRGGFLAWVSPDGRKMLMRVRPSNGSGVDLWLIDIEKRTARVVYPNFIVEGESQVAWHADRAMVTGYPTQLAVDLGAEEAAPYIVRWGNVR